MNRVYRDIGLFEWLAIALVVGLTLSWAVGKIPVGSAVAAGLSQGGGGELQQLRYNNPGLVVDLGVGLWAWPVPGDADGDGDYDLIVSCPDKPSNGVWFFENASGDTAQNPRPVFKPARRLSATRHYVMPSYVNGQMRVLAPGEEYRNFTRVGLAEPVKLPVAANFYQPEGRQPKGPKVRHNQWRYVDYDGDGALDLITGIEDWSFYGWDDAWNAKGEWTNGPLHGFVILHRNAGSSETPRYEPPVKLAAAGQPIDTFGCPSPNFEDFDRDGDLDLLTGEFLDGFTYFENTGTRTKPVYAAGRRLKDLRGRSLTMDLEMIVPVAFDWDRDGDFDLIVGDEDGRVALVENTGRLGSDRTPVFARPFYFKQQAETLKSGALATPVGVDWDGDGDQDIVSGNTAGYIEFFENLSGPRVEAPRWAAPRRLEVNGRPFRIMAGPNGSIQGPAEAKWGYTTLNIADWDGDGRLDIVYNSIFGRVEWLRNIGTRRMPRLAPPQPIEVEWEGSQPHLAWGWLRPTGRALLTQWRTTPGLSDLNGDGLVDLVMLDHEGWLAFFERARAGGKLILRHPRRIFVDESGAAIRLNARTAGGSGRRKICLTDWDGDGRLDLLLNSSNADLLRQVGVREGSLVMKNAGTLATRNIEGHDVSPAVVDFNGDGVPDFLGGAEDGRFYYLRNPRTVGSAGRRGSK
ncbi:MAG: FG-GAP repeat domain-containing protein [Blastocatellia bacterium]